MNFLKKYKSILVINIKKSISLYYYSKLYFNVTKEQKRLILNLSKKYLKKNIQKQINYEFKKTKITD
jgi:predicted solute-binding protein